MTRIPGCDDDIPIPPGFIESLREITTKMNTRTAHFVHDGIGYTLGADGYYVAVPVRQDDQR